MNMTSYTPFYRVSHHLSAANKVFDLSIIRKLVIYQNQMNKPNLLIFISKQIRLIVSDFDVICHIGQASPAGCDSEQGSSYGLRTSLTAS